MSRLYETLRRMEQQRGKSDPIQIASLQPVELVNSAMTEPSELESVRTAQVNLSQNARLVALTDPRGLGAEKFRALATRLEHLRKDRELKCLQITSAVGNEGKTLIAGNLAVQRTDEIEKFMQRSDYACVYAMSEVPAGSAKLSPAPKVENHYLVIRSLVTLKKP